MNELLAILDIGAECVDEKSSRDYGVYRAMDVMDKNNEHRMELLSKQIDMNNHLLKTQIIAHAIQSVRRDIQSGYSEDSFKYVTERGIQEDSMHIVVKILKAFQRGSAAYLPELDVLERNEFHARLSNQVHTLTGSKPKILFDQEKGRHAIYYSEIIDGWAVL